MTQDGAWRVLVTGGSTAGHVMSAIAVVDELRKLAADTGVGEPELLYVGSHTRAEEPLVKAAGLSFRAVQTGKLRTYASIENAIDLARLPIGIVQAARIVAAFGPRVVFSTGGFGAVPPAIAAWLLRVPVVTHDQTATIGLANQIIARVARRIAVSDERAIEHLGPRARQRAIVTGNPIRPGVLAGVADRAAEQSGFNPNDKLPVVYITGGSLGARSINRAVEDQLEAILKRWRVIHQTGSQLDDGVSELARLTTRADALPRDLRARYRPVAFLEPDRLADVYALASLVIGRSGAGTTSELAALGKPSVLIPLVPTRRDEQRKNAQRLADVGAAHVIDPSQLNGPRLRDTLLDLADDPARLSDMAGRSASLAHPHAPRTLAQIVLDHARLNEATRS